MKRKYLLVLIALFLFGSAYTQNCIIAVTSTRVCIGNAVTFSVTFNGGLVANSYAWNFGNGVTNNQASPTYNYPDTGTFTPSVTITFTNSSQCLVNGPPITILAKPIADFQIMSEDTQCFKNNRVCIKDNSRPGASGAALLNRTFLWGDGDFEPSGIGNKNFCHNYIDKSGGSYTLVIEVTDANNCLTRVQKDDAINVFPQLDPIGFTTQYSVQCNATPVTFLNTSILPLNKVKKFVWDFGDGTRDETSTRWNNFVHTYTKGGFFSPKLIVTDLNGCVDSIELVNGARNIKFSDQLVIDYTSKCFSIQDYSFSAPGAAGADISWVLYNANGTVFDSVFAQGYNQINKRFSCGRYKLRMYASLGTCKSVVDTFIDVYGPNTILTNDTTKPINYAQCQPNDTVFFRTPPAEISCFYQNVTNWLWDFGDGFAPPCTTDTKNGINVGVNCRYSKDSVFVKHKYPTSVNSCYKVKLIISDPIKNCSDEDTTLVILAPPSAGPDLPNRRGLYYYTIPPGENLPPQNCFTSNFIFKIDELLPTCGAERMWIMQDSLAPRWDSVYPFTKEHIVSYAETKDPRGFITVGLIVKNGICYDTAWYHKMIQILPLKPAFTLKLEGTCAPYKVTLNMVDSIQDSLVSAMFNFDVATQIQNFALTDSVINQRQFTFNSMGAKTIRVTLTNRKGCQISYDTTIYLGFLTNMVIPKTTVCLSDSVVFNDAVDYYSRITDNWRKESRALANKERLWYNFGDTNVFVAAKSWPKYKYKIPGNYTIKLAAQDSLGCRDTVTYGIKVKVVDVKAGIGTIGVSLICAPKIIPLKDASIQIDSSALYGQLPYDAITNYVWDFGDLKAQSLLKDPLHDYTQNGTFTLKHKVTTLAGCTDSISIPLTIKGPTPKYSFASGDTIGCSPVKLKVNNTTGAQLQSWQWTVNGPLDFIVSTKNDSAIDFSLVKAGRYRILLLGTDSIKDNVTGGIIFCTSVFPDTLNPNSKPIFVTVFDKPLVTLSGPDTICPYEEFTVKAVADTIYKQFLWSASNGFNKPLSPRTDTLFKYSFSDSGNYTIKLIPRTNAPITCIDTGLHQIHVRSIKANFDINDANSPTYEFVNKSINAVSYKWTFGQPSSGSANESTAKDPIHNYNNLNDSFKVCLIAKNAGDCYDTLCKVIAPVARLINIPNVFTPNGDKINDAFDIEILGHTEYLIQIYNRWGGKVFEGTKDGIRHLDGNNWNGTVDNNGSVCADGVYYYVFEYSFGAEKKAIKGSITLIRE